MIPIAQVRNMLESAFPTDQIQLTSPQGDDNHFQVLIVSERFAGKSMVEQHQLVYQALGGSMREAIHALALRTYTPEQWEADRG